MNRRLPFSATAIGVGWRRCRLSLVALLLCGNAGAQCPKSGDIDFNNCSALTCNAHYAAKINSPAGTITDHFGVLHGPAMIYWNWTIPVGCQADTKTNTKMQCAGVDITFPTPKGQAVASTQNATLSNEQAIGPDFIGATFSVTVTDADPPDIHHPSSCKRYYYFHDTGDGEGWGDPHMTTVDGVNYDFQGAGEFTLLRGQEETVDEIFEVQARQIPMMTDADQRPVPDDYTGLSTCPSIYTAVAAKLGNSKKTYRVTYQPQGGKSDSADMVLRLDGAVLHLDSNGIDLDTGERIVPSGQSGAIAIQYRTGTTVNVLPVWDDRLKIWYLDVGVSDTSYTDGIIGKTSGWLPALPDGSSLGSKPDDLHARYVQLYQQFTDAWRVTDDTSLFDYEPGTSTATFTDKAWPQENPQTCTLSKDLQGKPLAQAFIVVPNAKDGSVPDPAAVCGVITDKNDNANCRYDVQMTGSVGFVDTYKMKAKFILARRQSHW